MSVISKVKQNIRDYLTTKYDALYLEELEHQVQELGQSIKGHKNRLEEIKTARELLKDDIEANKTEIQQKCIWK